MATIGSRIKERRQELRLTQEDLAARMGYKSKSAINKIELGINDISQSKVVKFAEALQTTPSRLMGWEDSPADAGALAAKVLKNPDASQLMRTYFELDEADQYALRLMAESLKAKKKG